MGNVILGPTNGPWRQSGSLVTLNSTGTLPKLNPSGLEFGDGTVQTSAFNTGTLWNSAVVIAPAGTGSWQSVVVYETKIALTGTAGGVLAGTYPLPSFANPIVDDMNVQGSITASQGIVSPLNTVEGYNLVAIDTVYSNRGQFYGPVTASALLIPAYGAVQIAGDNSSTITIGSTMSAGYVSSTSGLFYSGYSRLTLKGSEPDGPTAVDTVLNSYITKANSGAKLLSVQNNSVEKAYVDKDGLFSSSAGYKFPDGTTQTTAGGAAWVPSYGSMAVTCSLADMLNGAGAYVFNNPPLSGTIPYTLPSGTINNLSAGNTMSGSNAGAKLIVGTNGAGTYSVTSHITYYESSEYMYSQLFVNGTGSLNVLTDYDVGATVGGGGDPTNLNMSGMVHLSAGDVVQLAVGYAFYSGPGTGPTIGPTNLSIMRVGTP